MLGATAATAFCFLKSEAVVRLLARSVAGGLAASEGSSRGSERRFLGVASVGSELSGKMAFSSYPTVLLMMK